MSLIQLSSINKTYQVGAHILKAVCDVNLTVHSGELTAVTGKSGSGKTTLMNIIGLLDHPSSGKYLLDGNDVAQLSKEALADIRSKTIGFVFQSFYLLERLTALQNICLPLLYQQVPFSGAEMRGLSLLERVGLKGFSDHKPSELSGGQQQRVAIARALITQPKLILADEPTGALDSQTEKEIIQLLIALNQEGKTILIITHNPEISQQCQRVITLKDGKICE